MESENDTGTSQVKRARPVAVTVLGWVFAAFSAFALLVSLFVLTMFTLMRRFGPPGAFPPSPPPDFPHGFAPLFSVFRHFQVLVGLEIALALFSIYAAVAFLRLKPWSRTYFEVLNWLVLAYTVGFSIFWVHLWRTMLVSMPNPSHATAGPSLAVMANFGTAMAIVVALFNSVIPALCIYFLRSHFVRPAFRPRAGARQGPTS